MMMPSPIAFRKRGQNMVSREVFASLRWFHNGHDSVSNHQPHGCLLNRLFRRSSKKTSKLCVTGLCVGNSPGTGEFPAQMASNAENVSIWWRYHVLKIADRKLFLLLKHISSASHCCVCWQQGNYVRLQHERKQLPLTQTDNQSFDKTWTVWYMYFCYHRAHTTESSYWHAST